ncbi:Alpha/Beta hydrolase protein [Naematelia encephala]|uniref:Alpha/Beta hydrolase protein n=1 Tax=Naematelia encephala TaxID=71784 RepID=A0A1Y2AWQ4_9TREE|nr:Alpha/Beta hydrolase protein [Naematelia encephala]
MDNIEKVPCYERSPWDDLPVDGEEETFEVEIHKPAHSILVPICLYFPSFLPPTKTTYESSKAERQAIDNLVSKANVLVIVVHFRQNSWDEALSDVKAALQWTLKSAPRFRADRHKIFIASTGLSSALAAALCLFDSSNDPIRYPGAPNKPGRIKGMMMHGPRLDHAKTVATDPLSPLVSPLLATSSDLRRLPPAAIFASKNDTSIEDGIQWSKLLNSNNVKATLTLYDTEDTAEILSSPVFLDTDQEEGAIFVLWESVFHPLLE